MPIKDISTVLQKLLRYFNSTILSTFYLELLSFWPIIFVQIQGIYYYYYHQQILQ